MTGLILLFYSFYSVSIRVNPFPPHQQPVGAAIMRMAGNKRTVVVSLLNRQIIDLTRKNNGDLIHFICNGFIQNRKREGISDFQLVQVMEQIGGGKIPMCA